MVSARRYLQISSNSIVSSAEQNSILQKWWKWMENLPKEGRSAKVPPSTDLMTLLATSSGGDPGLSRSPLNQQSWSKLLQPSRPGLLRSPKVPEKNRLWPGLVERN